MIELKHVDCMEYMKGLEDNAFELAIVDNISIMSLWII